MKPFWSVPRLWDGEFCFIICGGPSVLRQNLSLLIGKKVIVINSSYEAFPTADFLVFGDYRWWLRHKDNLINFKGTIVHFSERLRIDNKNIPVHTVRRNRFNPNMCLEPNQVSGQHTTLQMTLNFAYHLGVIGIGLLGADMKAEKRADKILTHHHNPHPWKVKPNCWDLQRKQLKRIAGPLQGKKVQVFNTSLESEIDWWPKISLEELIK